MRLPGGVLTPIIGLSLAALVALLFLLGILPPKGGQTAAATQTVPPALPTEDLGDPFDTLTPDETVPPDASSLSTDAQAQLIPGVTCLFVPAAVRPGDGWTLVINEPAGFYGSDRWYELSPIGGPFNIPNNLTGVGGAGQHILLSGGTPAGFEGTTWPVLLWVHDYDKHLFYPGSPPDKTRPAGSNHDGTCGAQLLVAP